MKGKISKLEEAQLKSEATINNMEQYSRRNNIRIFGLNENQVEDTFKIVQNLCKQTLEIDLDEASIDRCHRVGKMKSEMKSMISQ